MGYSKKSVASGTAFLRDIGLASIAPMVTKLKGIVLIPVISKWIGAEAFGVWNQFVISSGFIALFATIGTGPVINRFLAPMKQSEKYSSQFMAIAAVVLAASTVAAGLLMLAPGYTSRRIFGEDASLVPLYLLVGYLPVLAISNRVVTFLKTRRRFDLVTPFTVTRDFGSTALIAVLVIGTGNVISAISGYVAWEVGALVVIFELARREAGLKLVCPDFSQMRRYLAYGTPLVLVTVGERLAGIGDRYIIVSVLGIKEAGIYSVAYAAGSVGVLALKPLTQVLLPDFSVLVDEEKRMEIKRRLASVTKYFVASQAGAIVLLFFLSESVIKLFSTESFLEGAPVLELVPLGIAAFGLLQIGTQVLNAEESTRLVGSIWLGVGIVNIVANVIAVPLFGLVGGALATAFSYGTGAMVCWWRVWRQYPIYPGLRPFVAIIVASFSTCGALFLITKSATLDPVLTLFLGGGIGGIAYLAGLLAGGFVTEGEQRLLLRTLGLR